MSFFIFSLAPNKYQIIAIFLGITGLYLTLGYGGSIDNENINVNVNDNNNNVNAENISLGINLEESKKINAIRNVGELF